MIVIDWLQSLDNKDLYYTSVTLTEIQAGIEIIHGQDTERTSELEQWLDQVAATYNIFLLGGIDFCV